MTVLFQKYGERNISENLIQVFLILDVTVSLQLCLLQYRGRPLGPLPAELTNCTSPEDYPEYYSVNMLKDSVDKTNRNKGKFSVPQSSIL